MPVALPDPRAAAALFRRARDRSRSRRSPATVADALAALAAAPPGRARPRRHRAGRGPAARQRLRRGRQHPRRAGPLDARARGLRDRHPAGRQRRADARRLKVADVRRRGSAAVLADLDAFLLRPRRERAQGVGLGDGASSRTTPTGPSSSSACIALAIEELEHFGAGRRASARDGASPWRPDPQRLPAAPRAAIPRGKRAVLPGSAADRRDRRGARLRALRARRGGAARAGPLKDFYRELARAEVRHQELYIDLARLYFDRARGRRAPRGAARRRRRA